MKNRELEFYRLSPLTDVLIPYFDTGVRAGFPSPAEDYTDLKIDLNNELIRNKFVFKIIRIKLVGC